MLKPVVPSVLLILTLPAVAGPVGVALPGEIPENVLTVCSEGCDYTSVQDAVDAAESGDTVFLGPETFREEVSIGGDDVAIQGSGSEKTVVAGFRIDSNATATLSQLTCAWRSIRNEGNLTLEHVVVRDNVDEYGIGVGIHNTGVLAIKDSVITRNFAMYDAGIYSWNASGDARLTIDNSTISDNSSWLMGAGVHSRGLTSIRGSTIRGNLSQAYSGIYVSGSATVTDCTISDNTNLVPNSAITAAEPGTSLALSHSTVTANEGIGVAVMPGGALDDQSIRVTIRNSIVANHLSDCYVWEGTGSISSLGHNLDSDGSCNLNQPTDQPDVNPELGPLQDNGGPTWTHVPLEGSPVIDRGMCDLGRDQRGVPRPIDGNLDNVWLCDIGAVEYVPHCDEPDRPCDDGQIVIPGSPGGDAIVVPADSD
jgi:hypothetical protein